MALEYCILLTEEKFKGYSLYRNMIGRTGALLSNQGMSSYPRIKSNKMC